MRSRICRGIGDYFEIIASGDRYIPCEGLGESSILHGILVFVILYAVRDVRRRSARNDWERTLDVAIVLVNDGTANQHAIESLSMRAPALADRLTVEARRYAPQALPPFRFVVKGPILASSPPDPPADGAWNHVQYAWDLASYTRKVDASADLDADLFDSRIYVTLHGGSLAGSSVEGASQANGRVGIVKVDLDPEMPRLFTTHAALSALNEQAFRDPRVHLVQADAFVWLESTTDTFDFAIVDFPDPSSFSLGKLYTTTFYRLLGRHLAPGARFVVQSTSPLFARQSFWCVVRTLEAVGFEATPYHVYVPSFGEWGFVLAGHGAYSTPTGLPQGLRYLTTETLPAMLQFPPDMQAVDVEPNRLNNQALVRYYEHEWTTINR